MFLTNDRRKISFGKIVYPAGVNARDAINDYNTRRKAEQAAIKNRQDQYLAAQKNPTVFNLLKGLFERTNLLMDYYNRQADMSILKLSQTNTEFNYNPGYHGIGDNCYEFAMRDMLDGYSYPFDIVCNPGFTTPETNYPEVLPGNLAPGAFENFLLNNINIDVQKITQGALKIDAFWDGNIQNVPTNYDKCCIWGITGQDAHGNLEYDYHFYRRDLQTGYWMQKCGACSVTCFDNDGNLISNPMAATTTYYKHFPVAYFKVVPNK